MNISVTSSNISSQSLKRPSPKTWTKKGSQKPTKRRRKDREFSPDSDYDGRTDDLYSCRLSSETRDAVLQLRKIKDPFDHELQIVVDNVFLHLEQQPEENVDLAESALLLSSVTQVYSSQVKSLHEQVLETAARLTGSESPQKGKSRKKKTDATNEGGPVVDDKPNEGGSVVDDKPNEGAVVGDKSNPMQLLEDKLIENSDTTTINDTIEISDGDGNKESENNIENNQESVQTAEGSNNSNSDSPNGTKEDELDATEKAKLEAQILTEIPGPCTRRRSDRLKAILHIEKETEKEKDYKLKKRKYDDDPPDLISCHDEWNAILEYMKSNGDLNFDEILPPVLEIQVGRRKKQVTINNNVVDNDDNNCETCQRNGNEMENKTDKGEPTTSTTICSSLSQQYETLDHLSNDVQERFHLLIQQMHTLPFDYGLMKNDMFKEYQQKFIQAVTLLSQNSVLVKRNDTKSPEPPAEDLQMDTQMSDSDQAISSIAELLNQVRIQAAEDFNKGKQSKYDAEVPISQMIATLKRIICSRYKKWHVRTDGDKAVFKRIKEFEDKVKAVLRREAEQGLFDVKKYEMEVMDVTLKESQDGEGEEYFSPASPVSCHDYQALSPRADDSKLWALNSLSRRTSIAGSLDGSSWIRLVDIFSRMKKIDNSETCRHFYAVLALLSHKNLSINYDALFSQESAKLITKLLQKQSEKQSVDKYPVGAKIMTSRCPDIDRDEVFLAPVFNAELQQVLEQDYLSSSGYQSDSQASTSTNLYSPAPTKTIQEAISEFVETPGEPLDLDTLFNTRRRKH